MVLDASRFDTVVLVHVGAGQREQQARGEWRRSLSSFDCQTNVSGFDLPQEQLLQLGNVEVIVQAFAKGFGYQREIGLAPSYLKQIAAAQTLKPERGSLPRRRGGSSKRGLHSVGNAMRIVRCWRVRQG